MMNTSNSRTNIRFRNWPAIIAAIAALVSAVMALLSWWYSKELSKPALSLTKVEAKAVRSEDKSKIQINFTYYFKNTGGQSLLIDDFKIGHITLEKKKFSMITKRIALNPIHPESGFNYTNNISTNVDPTISDHNLEKNLPNLFGANILIIPSMLMICSN